MANLRNPPRLGCALAGAWLSGGCSAPRPPDPRGHGRGPLEIPAPSGGLPSPIAPAAKERRTWQAMSNRLGWSAGLPRLCGADGRVVVPSAQLASIDRRSDNRARSG
jgi:hypothetical protein